MGSCCLVASYDVSLRLMVCLWFPSVEMGSHNQSLLAPLINISPLDGFLY